MRLTNIITGMALLAIMYSCGNNKKSTAQTEVGTNDLQMPKITLTVESGRVLNLDLASDADSTQIKILSDKRDTSFKIGKKVSKVKYLPSSNTVTIYGNILKFGCISNSIKALDVSKNTLLQSLSCAGNMLTSLDLSKNIALTDLSCYDNKLSKLDLSKNTALQELSCGMNNLTSLNLSKNTALTTLYCGSISITTLDVSKNTDLTELECEYTDLKSLNLKNNKELTFVNIGSTPIAESPENVLNFFKSLPDRSNQRAGALRFIGLLDKNNLPADKIKNIAKSKNWEIYL